MTPWRKTRQTARAIYLNLPSWCVSIPESFSELHLCFPNTSAPGGWLYAHIFQGQGTLHRSGVAQPQCRRPVPEDPCHTLVCISDGRTGGGREALALLRGLRLAILQPWWKAAWALSWIRQNSPGVYITMLTMLSHVRDGMQYKLPCSRLCSLLNKECLPVLGHRCRT